MNDLEEIVSLSDTTNEPALDELVLHCGAEMAALRRSDPHRQRLRVELLPGDVCARGEPLSTLQTSLLNTHTLGGIADRPVMVGSVFQLRFDRRELDVPPALAVCERCAMLNDTSFELRLRFAHPMETVVPGA